MATPTAQNIKDLLNIKREADAAMHQKKKTVEVCAFAMKVIERRFSGPNAPHSDVPAHEEEYFRENLRKEVQFLISVGEIVLDEFMGYIQQEAQKNNDEMQEIVNRIERLVENVEGEKAAQSFMDELMKQCGQN